MTKQLIKDKELHKCPKCKGMRFHLRFRTFEEFGEEFEGEYFAVECVKCKGTYWSFGIDQRIILHAERAYIKEQLGEPLTKPTDINSED